MLNTGKLLKKPEESGYARFRRFLIANHCSNKNKQKFRSELFSILDRNSNQYFRGRGRKNTSELCKLVEYYDSRVKQNPINNNSNADALKALEGCGKNCPECAEIGYHTKLFDLPWINFCPIHKQKLLTHCPICNQGWPSTHDLFRKECTGCSARLDFNDLIKKDAFEASNKYKEIIFISKIIQPIFNTRPIFSFLNQIGEISVRQPINSQSAFWPSVLLSNGRISTIEKKRLQKSRLPFFKYFNVKFISEEITATKKPRPLKEKIKSKIIRKTYSKIYVCLQNMTNSNHKLGSCIKIKSDMKEACAACKTWAFYGVLLSNEKNYLFSEYQSNKNNLSYHLNLELSTFHRTKFSISLPDVMTSIQIINHNSNKVERIINIPQNIQALIYSIDLWSMFNHIHESFIDINEQLDEQDSVSNLDNLITFLSAPENKLSCPFYLSENGNNVTMVIPNFLLQRSMNYCSNIHRLKLHNPFNHALVDQTLKYNFYPPL